MTVRLLYGGEYKMSIENLLFENKKIRKNMFLKHKKLLTRDLSGGIVGSQNKGI